MAPHSGCHKPLPAKCQVTPQVLPQDRISIEAFGGDRGTTLYSSPLQPGPDPFMRQALLIVDVQSTFSPSEKLVDGIRALSAHIPTVASIELHDEQATPFQRQLGWHPASEDVALVEADQVFVKHGYGQTAETLDYLKGLGVERVLVCGLQTETCVLAAGFALFDAGLCPT
jgi:nicotinamidase-related amidase